MDASFFITGIHETGLCVNCGEKETVEHVICNCTRYDKERKELISYLNEKGKVNNSHNNFHNKMYVAFKK